MTQSGTRVPPSYDELERALSSVPGVLTATVAVTERTGRGRLRLSLAPGEDPDAVSWAVAATLRERFGIALDPEAIRPRVDATGGADDGRPRDQLRRDGSHHPQPVPIVMEASRVPPPTTAAPTVAAPAERGSCDGAGSVLAGATRGRVRAAIRDLVTHQGDHGIEVIATLEFGGRQGTSTTRSIPTRRGIWRAIAEATVGALSELTDDHLHVGVDRVTVTSGEVPAMVTVVVCVLSDRGEETLLGASLLRDDPENAVMRATLDALNRRVEPLLPQPVSG